jgi:hypothetical protein
MWLFLNGRAKNNRPGEWCAFESIIRHGIVNCLLTTRLSNLFRICSCSWSCARKVWRVSMRRWWFRLHCQTWVPGDGHYRWLRGPINPFSMEHRTEYLVRTIRRILDFLRLWSILQGGYEVVIHLRLFRWKCYDLSLILILFKSLIEVKLNKYVLWLHPKNLTSTSLVLEDSSTD